MTAAITGRAVIRLGPDPPLVTKTLRCSRHEPSGEATMAIRIMSHSNDVSNVSAPVIRGAPGFANEVRGECPAARGTRDSDRHTMRTLASLLCLSGGIYALGVRPRLLRWGATDDEVRRPYPGDHVIRGGTRSATMGVTIDAAPTYVWPWLVQMGTDRAGWYSWDRLDNWGHPSAERIHPEWQTIALGDRLSAMADGSIWWEVAALEPERFLGLRMSLDLRGRPFDPGEPHPRFSTDSLWGFLLEEESSGRTRLVVSGYWSLRPRWLQPIMSVLFLEPEHWIMQMQQFRNLKRRVERTAMVTRDRGRSLGRPPQERHALDNSPAARCARPWVASRPVTR